MIQGRHRAWECMKGTLIECERIGKSLLKKWPLNSRRRTSEGVRVQVWLLNVHNKMTALSSYPPQYSCHSEISVLTSSNNIEHLPTDTCKIQPKFNCFWSLLKRLDIEKYRFLFFTLNLSQSCEFYLLYMHVFVPSFVYNCSLPNIISHQEFCNHLPAFILVK